MMPRVISEYVQHQLFTAGGEDEHGNPAESWADPVTVGVYAFDPGSTSEPRMPGHDRVVVEPTLYMPSSVMFGYRDRVTARGVLFEVEGECRLWVHPTETSRSAHVVTLRHVGG